MLELAQVRGWDTEPLAAAFIACRDANCELRLESKPTTSPDRRHVAQLFFSRDVDGRARVVLTIARRGTGAIVGQTAATGSSDVRHFRRMTRQFRWTSVTDVLADDDDRTWSVPGHHRLVATVGVFQDVPLMRTDW